MAKIFTAICLVLATVVFVSADELDDTFNKVDKHLYGIDNDAPPPPPPPIREEYQPPPPQYEPPPQRAYEPPPPREEAAPPPQMTGDDDHYIQGDDYFIQKHDLGTRAWMYVILAKVVSPPSGATKGEGEFMQVRDGQNLWTKNFWRTRKAVSSDLRMGTHVICFDSHKVKGVYESPPSKEKARGGQWFYAKITDTSDLFKGFVTVSGNYKVGVNNIRIMVR